MKKRAVVKPDCMLPGTARQSDSEKERCGPGTKDK